MKTTKVKSKDSGFTARERLIREALFSVFYEKDWHLEFRPLEPETVNVEADLERWTFADRVIDEIRKTQKQNR